MASPRAASDWTGDTETSGTTERGEPGSVASVRSALARMLPGNLVAGRQIHYAVHDQPVVQAPLSTVQRVLEAALSSAVGASPEGAPVAIDLRARDGCGLVEIRAQSAEGLPGGLDLARTLVDAYGGDISCVVDDAQRLLVGVALPLAARP